jgi:hypothetical protein
VTKTVKSSGGDYSSLSAWEAGQQGDLVAADEIRQAECYSFEDTTQTIINGSTTDTTRYLRAYTPASERHNGKWDTSKYRLIVSNADVIQVFDEYVRIEGLQLQTTNPTANYRASIFCAVAAASDVRISHNICRGHGNAAYIENGTNCNDGSGTFRIWNNVFFGYSTEQSTLLAGNAGASGVLYVYSNTCIMAAGASGAGISSISSTVHSKNNLVTGSGTCFNQPSGTLTNTNCASSDATADDFGGSGNRVSQTFTFVDAGSFDYHLAVGDAGAKDFGTDLSGDANLPFSDDIDGVTRSGTWDIGADEYVAAGGSVVPVLMRQYRQRRVM